jgi:uncharacterized protein (UPF0216 family)
VKRPDPVIVVNTDGRRVYVPRAELEGLKGHAVERNETLIELAVKHQWKIDPPL